MAMWTISLVDQFKASNGSSEANLSEREDLDAFKVTMDQWAQTRDKIVDKRKSEAWRRNHQGLQTHMTTGAKGDCLFRVRQSTTSLVYLMGKLRFNKWGLDISEVISNTDPAADIKLFEDFVDAEAATEYQTKEAIDTMRGRIASTKTDVGESVPLGCLFAWAASNSNKVTLTANTVGLISLYGIYGFELDAMNPVIRRGLETVQRKKEAYLADKKFKDEYEDAKYMEVNALMKLSSGGKEQLTNKYRLLVHYIGTSLAQ